MAFVCPSSGILLSVLGGEIRQGRVGWHLRKKWGNLNVPMGSTKKVGESVRGGREYDDSLPTLYSRRLGERREKAQDQHSLGRKGMGWDRMAE